MKFATKALHVGIEPDPSTGAIMTPIFQTSTYVQDEPGVHKGYQYARTQNPTREALEKNLAALENAQFGRCFSSGMSATETVIKTLSPGDEVISISNLYGGTYRLFTQLFAKYGIKFTFVNMEDIRNVASVITDKTKLIWMETPTNPMMNIADIKGIAELSEKKDIKVAVDNTFASPYLQNPLNLGADIVMHSVTKYIAGHSDVLMGFLCTNDPVLDQEFGFIQNSSGAVPGPQDCFLALRGIKTLHLRMQRHCENGEQVASYLKNHSKIKNIFWPGFEDHPNHEIAKSQMRGFGGMISFTQNEDTEEQANKILTRFKIFSLAESLGGVESLVGHPASMTHAIVPREHRLEMGLTDSLIRLSVGIEDINDLIADLAQALK